MFLSIRKNLTHAAAWTNHNCKSSEGHYGQIRSAGPGRSFQNAELARRGAPESPRARLGFRFAPGPKQQDADAERLLCNVGKSRKSITSRQILRNLCRAAQSTPVYS